MVEVPAGRQRDLGGVHGRLPSRCGLHADAALRVHRQHRRPPHRQVHDAGARLQRHQRRQPRRQPIGVPGVHDLADRRLLVQGRHEDWRRGVSHPEGCHQEQIWARRVQRRGRGRLRPDRAGQQRGARCADGGHQEVWPRVEGQDRHRCRRVRVLEAGGPKIRPRLQKPCRPGGAGDAEERRGDDRILQGLVRQVPLRLHRRPVRPGRLGGLFQVPGGSG
mmetsp:Transcript_39083/g.99233  ORF Transcript_39083/g.99233 Transcript_39083/m.99233 type:complete len:220 (+) Transcript_39083:911-1570(+)